MAKSEQILRKEYTDVQDKLNSWGSHVDKTVDYLLREMNANLKLKLRQYYRRKSMDSYISKALYRGENHDNPIIDIWDKIGTRVVFLTTRDVEEASFRLMRHPEWKYDITRDISARISKKPLEFDYQSFHLVVRPIETIHGYNSEECEQLRCEIQLRTLLQHAFAEISHDNAYKGPFKNDGQILRNLSKSMALMEATDDYFCRIYEMITDEKRKFRNFANELIRIFQGFRPDFKGEQLDINLMDSVFELLLYKDISVFDLEIFIAKKKSELDRVLVRETLHIFNQPAVILMYYYLKNHYTLLVENWPIESSALSELKRAFNISSKY